MEKIDLGLVKTSHRIRNGVEQKMRLYNKDQQKMVIKEVENKPSDLTIVDVLNLYEITPAVYYSWVRSFSKKPKIMDSAKFKMEVSKLLTKLNNARNELDVLIETLEKLDD